MIRPAAALLLALSAQPALAALPPPEKLTIPTETTPLRLWARSAPTPHAAILFIHGRTWSARPNFDLQTPDNTLSILQAFANQGFAAYAIDLPGYGETPREPTGWLTPNHAAADTRAALAWITQRTGHRPTLVGYSNGALVAALAAQTYPESLSALVLYGFPLDLYATLKPETTPPAAKREPTTLKAAASDFITPEAASPETIAAYAEQAVKADPIRADWAHLDEFNAIDPTRIFVPTLLIQGVRDQYVRPDAEASFFTHLATQSRAWIILPHADHAAHVERSHAAWVDGIVHFIETKE
jgi:alpha-beta hydrolase superfamily lysophospholipase